jgi:hypothetical protein
MISLVPFVLFSGFTLVDESYVRGETAVLQINVTLDIEPEMNYIALLHDVVFSFEA